MYVTFKPEFFTKQQNMGLVNPSAKACWVWRLDNEYPYIVTLFIPVNKTKNEPFHLSRFFFLATAGPFNAKKAPNEFKMQLITDIKTQEIK